MPNPRLSRRDPERITFAREQRKLANEFAQDVWQMVRGRRIRGQKFRREHPVGPYTVDFVCLALMLVLEVDGKDHLTEEGKRRDAERDRYLREQGYEVIRFRGFEVTQDTRSIKERIVATVDRMRAESPSPPTPLPEAGRGEPE